MNALIHEAWNGLGYCRKCWGVVLRRFRAVIRRVDRRAFKECCARVDFSFMSSSPLSKAGGYFAGYRKRKGRGCRCSGIQRDILWRNQNRASPLSNNGSTVPAKLMHQFLQFMLTAAKIGASDGYIFWPGKCEMRHNIFVTNLHRLGLCPLTVGLFRVAIGIIYFAYW